MRRCTDLPMPLIKVFTAELTTFLISIINASLQQSKCLSTCKSSYIILIGKTTKSDTFSELRPIDITSLPSLLCESFVAEWVYEDLAPEIDARQFGNMKASSTTHCLTSLLDFFYTRQDKRTTYSYAVCTFIKFRKAFDLIDHSKAISTRIKACLISWIARACAGRSVQHLASQVRGASGHQDGPPMFPPPYQQRTRGHRLSLEVRR